MTRRKLLTHWPPVFADAMSEPCRQLIDALLQPDPSRRLGHRGAAEVKMHPFFEVGSWHWQGAVMIFAGA